MRPDISIIISTYQMPGHLRRVLASVARQTVLDRLEIIVTDDGSSDETAEVVREFAQLSDRGIGFVTHKHEGFHLTRCRNDGARIASAPYLLFLDGDCLIPRDHAERYLQRQRKNTVHFGYCYRLDEPTSLAIGLPQVASGSFENAVSASEVWKLRKIHWKAEFYRLIGHRTKPALKGGNIGIWRDDFERLNGFDECFRDWGCEDDDLSYRARAAGLSVASILGSTQTYHLWHRPAVMKWSEGKNVAYLKRPGRLTSCRFGLRKRTLAELRVTAFGSPAFLNRLRVAGLRISSANESETSPPCELEVHESLATAGAPRVGECRLLLSDSPSAVAPREAAKFDYVIDSTGMLTTAIEACLAGDSPESFARDSALPAAA